jgi:hypothetical protein
MTRRTVASFILIAVAITGLNPRPLAAQYPAPAGIHRTTSAESNARDSSGALSASAPVNATSVAHGVLVGAGVGAGVGLIIALAAPHSSHADNGLGYIAATTIGAFVGMIVGGAIGATK